MKKLLSLLFLLNSTWVFADYTKDELRDFNRRKLIEIILELQGTTDTDPGSGGDDEERYGCQTLRKIKAITQMSDRNKENLSGVKQLFRVMCKSRTNESGSVYYSNGKLATSNAASSYSSWYYPNGKLATPNNGANYSTWKYPNGRTVTPNIGASYSTWFYPNGKTISPNIGANYSAWKYPNGQTITSNIGASYAAWYYPNGKRWSNQAAMKITADDLKNPVIVLRKIKRALGEDWDFNKK